jgi:Ca2+-dependent lipid-binding protein
VYRSKEIKNNLNPTWETAVIDLSTLCGGNLDNPVMIEVFDFESDGKHKLMGKVRSVTFEKNYLTNTPLLFTIFINGLL